DVPEEADQQPAPGRLDHLFDGRAAAVHHRTLVRVRGGERFALFFGPVAIVEQVLDDALFDPGDRARGESVGADRRLAQHIVADRAADGDVVAEDLLTEFRRAALLAAHEAAAFL